MVSFLTPQAVENFEIFYLKVCLLYTGSYGAEWHNRKTRSFTNLKREIGSWETDCFIDKNLSFQMVCPKIWVAVENFEIFRVKVKKSLHIRTQKKKPYCFHTYTWRARFAISSLHNLFRGPLAVEGLFIRLYFTALTIFFPSHHVNFEKTLRSKKIKTADLLIYLLFTLTSRPSNGGFSLVRWKQESNLLLYLF